MSNNQSDYTYSSSQPTSVSVSTTGDLLFLSKPSGSVTITATPKSTVAPGSPAVTYTFDPTNVWVVPDLTTTTYSTSLCGGVANQLTRAQLTNSPRNTAPIGWSGVSNSYTRAIGGGVFNEWGWSDGTSYPNSKWVSDIYWTRDAQTTGSRQFYVNSFSGGVGSIHFNSDIYIVCKG